MADRVYTDADLDAAIAAISEPGRLSAAEELIAHAAPALQRVLDEALNAGGWFDSAHQQAVREAAGEEDPQLRALAVRTLVAEETRLGMFVGVAVGFELARELGQAQPGSSDAATGDSPLATASESSPPSPPSPPNQEE